MMRRLTNRDLGRERSGRYEKHMMQSIGFLAPNRPPSAKVAVHSADPETVFCAFSLPVKAYCSSERASRGVYGKKISTARNGVEDMRITKQLSPKDQLQGTIKNPHLAIKVLGRTVSCLRELRACGRNTWGIRTRECAGAVEFDEPHASNSRLLGGWFA